MIGSWLLYGIAVFATKSAELALELSEATQRSRALRHRIPCARSSPPHSRSADTQACREGNSEAQQACSQTTGDSAADEQRQSRGAAAESSAQQIAHRTSESSQSRALEITRLLALTRICSVPCVL